MPAALMEHINRQPGPGVLATSDREGKVDAAVFGSARMTDENTVVMALGNNRTLANLQQNPHAAYLIVKPGKTLAEWKGVRVYLTMQEVSTSGPMLDSFRSQIARRAGEQAARMIHAVVSFRVGEIRPLVDMGQGWEKSL